MLLPCPSHGRNRHRSATRSTHVIRHAPAAERCALTRRSLVGLGLAAGVGLGAFTGCSRAEQGSDDPAPATTSAAVDPTAPTRIATLDPFSTYNLLDLGLEPVVAQAGLEAVINPAHAEAYAAIPKGGEYFELNLEAIAAESPELILASTGQAEAEAELAKIAPTVLITATTSSTWRQAATEVAEATGRTAVLAELEQAYEDRAAAIRAGRAGVLGELTWAMVWQGQAEGFSVRSALSNGGQVLDLAGVRWNEVTSAADGDADTKLSWEQIEQLADADVICLPGSTSTTPNEQTEFTRAQKVFQNLPAVGAGRVYVFDHLTPGSYLNASQLLEELDSALVDLS